MSKRYLNLCSLDHALGLLMTSFPGVTRRETVPLTESPGRVVATPVYARYSVPEVNLAAMDGFAVRSRDTVCASDQNPLRLDCTVQVNTGNIVPPGFDAVIMIEDTWLEGSTIEIRKPAIPWQHIRLAGEDIRDGQLVVPEGHLLRPFDIGALATYGIVRVDVRVVNVGLIPTGSELVPLGIRPAPGQVVESNTVMAQVFLKAMGARCTRYPVVRDDPELIEDALRTAVNSNDLIIISAGSSSGTRDFTAQVIESMGELLFHGVALKPGKPVMLGNIDGKPVLGLPGYPLAAQTVIREFAVPLLEAWGLSVPAPHTVTARLAHTLSSDIGFDEFIPVSLGRIGATCWAVPHSRGSSVQTASVKANGFIHIPAAVEGFEAGSGLDGVLTTDPGNIDRTLILTGVYDPAIPALTHLIRNQGIFLHASIAGNIGAMLALKRNSCHAALLSVPEFSLLPGSVSLTHLFPLSGLTFVHIASVSLGLVSPEGFIFKDLENVRFINQHKGSPGRILFDTLLEARGMNIARIDGYIHEVSSNQAVANAIRNGYADVGICSSSIAKEYGLCFQPLAMEQYELAARNELVNHHLVDPLISQINSLDFRQQLLENGGYELSQTGAVRCMSDETPNPYTFVSHVSNA